MEELQACNIYMYINSLLDVRETMQCILYSLL